METKSLTKLPFLLKSPPVFTTDGNQGFIGAFPPTGEDVILQYYGYHNYLQRGYQIMVGENWHHTIEPYLHKGKDYQGSY